MREPARPDDLAAVQDLLGRAGLPFADFTAEHLRLFIVVRDAGSVIGVVGLERFGNDGLLRSLAVEAKYQAAGLGRALVDAIEAHGRQLSVKHLYLLTLTAADFFAKSGYQVVPRGSLAQAIQRSSEHASLCPTSAICLYKRL